MEISSADFCKLTIQEVADLLLEGKKNVAICRGKVDDKEYSLYVEITELNSDEQTVIPVMF